MGNVFGERRTFFLGLYVHTFNVLHTDHILFVPAEKAYRSFFTHLNRLLINDYKLYREINPANRIGKNISF